MDMSLDMRVVESLAESKQGRGGVIASSPPVMAGQGGGGVAGGIPPDAPVPPLPIAVMATWGLF